MAVRMKTGRPTREPLAIAAAAALMLSLVGGCSWLGDRGPVRVAAIGALNRTPVRGPLSLPDRLLLDAAAQGLVGFAADGSVEAGLAERWTVIDGGRSYIFRLREARWADGRPVVAGQIATLLQRRIAAPDLRPMLRGEFRSVRDIRAMTGKVIEIRLSRPQPDLLDLLAQPDLALTPAWNRAAAGWGPARARWIGRTAALTPLGPMAMAQGSAGDGAAADDAARPPASLLWGTTTARAVAQFDGKAADVVLGGRFEGWPLIDAAGVDRGSVLIDPVDGLFGLAIVDSAGPLGEGLMRDAAAMAIDPSRAIAAVNVPGWAARTTLRNPAVPPGGIAPVYPAWTGFAPAERQRRAQAIVADWRARNGGATPRLRIALPAGAGARMLYARLKVDLARVGIDTRRVAIDADADLRLLDEVAPGSDPAWFLRRLTCRRTPMCSADADGLVAAIDDTADATARAAALLAAEEAIMRTNGFIPLAAPLRWSLASARTRALRPNPRGRHSLSRLVPAAD